MNRSRRQRIGLRDRGQHRIQTVTISAAAGGAAATLVFGAVLAGGTAQAEPAVQPPPPALQAPSPAGAGTGSPVGQLPLDPSGITPDAGGTQAPGGNLVPPATTPRSSHSGSSSSSSGSSGSGSQVHVRSGGS